ncbi:hypothetical protein MuYL_3174 [Mucilaginibacter xinganensis]|uniref:Uncharacterized protein n=1 Tax=Mucilaginibacter xinganensis TaxID=1234841 RepID=A0A223NYU5_9SPHI|nr:hypothetical protein MuYL_3174 [Mucilaginibacter xinganensis]
MGKGKKEKLDELILHGAQSKLRAVLKTKLKTIIPLCNQYNGGCFYSPFNPTKKHEMERE